VPEFEAARDSLGSRVVHFGYADRKTYRTLLRDADIVVSTARHEFFGVAVVEAIYARCFPVLPHRLSYPEILPRAFHARCLYHDAAELVSHLRWALTHAVERRRFANELRLQMRRYGWHRMAAIYDDQLMRVDA
jgi:glycosyltransferase involved in cell wall biosynthesis